METVSDDHCRQMGTQQGFCGLLVCIPLHKSLPCREVVIYRFRNRRISLEQQS